MQKAMSLVPTDKIGEIVVSTLAIGAGVLKWASDRGVSKSEKEEAIPSTSNDSKVITKVDFDKLVSQVEEANSTLLEAKNSFEDTLACITIINILLQVIATDRRKVTLKAAEEQVFAFLRHATFPSRNMVVTIVETTISEIDNMIEEENKNDMDS